MISYFAKNQNFINAKFDNPWNIATTFGNHLFKLGFVCLLLIAPLPRMITDVAIEPIFNVEFPAPEYWKIYLPAVKFSQLKLIN